MTRPAEMYPAEMHPAAMHPASLSMKFRSAWQDDCCCGLVALRVMSDPEMSDPEMSDPEMRNQMVGVLAP